MFIAWDGFITLEFLYRVVNKPFSTWNTGRLTAASCVGGLFEQRWMALDELYLPVAVRQNRRTHRDKWLETKKSILVF